MSDFNATNLAGDIAYVAVTLTATPTPISTLVNSAIATLGGYGTSNILQVTILGTQSASATLRGAIIYGDSVSQPGYLSAGDEKTWPVRGKNVLLARAATPDVSAVLEVYLRKT